MATRLEKIFWSVLCGAALGLGGCEDNEPREDAGMDVYGPPPDTDFSDTRDSTDMQELEIVHPGPDH